MHTQPETQVFLIPCSLSSALPASLIVLTQSAPINKSASAFDDSQCECFFPSNCLRANISFILSHEKSVPSSFQIANFAHFSPCFVLFFFCLPTCTCTRARSSSDQGNASESWLHSQSKGCHSAVLTEISCLIDSQCH